jgi:hypothetical protein
MAKAGKDFLVLQNEMKLSRTWHIRINDNFKA